MNQTVKMMRYRPEIDGLRAIAVLCVVIFHVFPTLLPSGFIGVDMFFAISGFLITGILLRSHDDGSFSMGNFWARRVKRLMPALILVSLSAVILGYFTFYGEQFVQLGRHLKALFLLSSNTHASGQFGYWSEGAESMPLLHTWSLGVEEQFYLLFVIALSITLKYSTKKVAFCGVVLLAVISYGLSVVFSESHPDQSFYLLHTRIWEMLVGSMFAFSLQNKQVEKLSEKRYWDLLGVGVLIAAFTFIDGEMAFPGWVAILPVLGTSLVLFSGASAVSKRVLSWNVCVYIGKISYSLYLWHWVVIVYAKPYFYLHDLTVLEGGAMIGASFVLAVLTYHFVENPLRRLKGKGVLIGTLGGVIAMIVLGLAIRKEWIHPLAETQAPNTAYYTSGGDSSVIDYNLEDDWLQKCPKIDGDDVDIVVFGSSHAAMYGMVIDELCKERGLSVAFFASISVVAPYFELFEEQKNFYGKWDLETHLKFDDYRKSFLSEKKPKLIITLDRYDSIKTNAGAIEFDSIHRAYFTELLGMSDKMMTVTQAPFASEKISSTRFLHLVNRRSGNYRFWEGRDTRGNRIEANDTIEKICEDIGERAICLDIEDLFLFEDRSTVFANKDNVLHYMDDNHLSNTGARLVKGSFSAAFDEVFPESLGE